ncbi:MAG: phosphodiesterase [Rhodospirillaceae bacterium]|nr:phosphodiesterase [Rhodospirillaceae bacterium]MBT4939546.1 phosphodiesterase [Rhodospirillaceae bacterium]MBT5938381.1 phosphodiesterase [Rhodospirillaceae bacterium]MBT7265420.1 phosphodiesterase [Rhodospirillaceae bacterium]
MIIAQIADTHLGATDADDLTFRVRAENLQACITDINSLNPLPDAVIHTGDLTQHGQPAEFAHARELLAALNAPFYITPGNRDGRDGIAEAFAKEEYMKTDGSFVHYAVEAHLVRLVAMDSLGEPGEPKGEFCPDRLARLDATLAEVPQKPTAIFMHHPPFDVPTAPDPFAYQRREAVADLAAVISKHPQVVRIFAGHMHRPWTAEIGGVAASTVPSVATNLRYGEYPDEMAEQPIYQLHRFDSDFGFASETRLTEKVST